MNYQINKNLIPEPLSPEEKKGIKNQIESYVSFNSVVIAMLGYMPTCQKFPWDKKIVHTVFYKIINEQRDFPYFDGIKFDVGGIYPYSEELDNTAIYRGLPHIKGIFQLTKHLKKRLRKDASKKFSDDEMKKIVIMAEKLEKYLMNPQLITDN